MGSGPAIAAGVVSLAVGSAASADLVGSKLVNLGDIGAGANSYRAYLIFDNALDQLLAINGDANVNAMRRRRAS